MRTLTQSTGGRKSAKRACKASAWGGGSTWGRGATWGAPDKSADGGRIRVGEDDDGGGGISIERRRLEEALMALNNFMWECKEA